MPTIKPLLGSQQSFTCTLASLANNSARASAAVNVSSDLVLDVIVQVQIRSASAGTSSSGQVNIYVYGSLDGGTTYTDGVSGSDGAATIANARLAHSIAVVANSTTYKSTPFSLAAAFGGTVPERFGIIVENKSGAALDSTEGNHLKMYQTVQATF